MNSAYVDRILSLQKKLKRIKTDAFLIVDRANTFYFTGFKGTASYIIMTLDQSYFFTDFRYIEHAKNTIEGMEVLLIEKNAKSQIKRIANRSNIAKIGFEGTLHYSDYSRFRKFLPDVDFIEQSNCISSMRQTKSDYEIELLRESIKQNDLIFNEIRKSVKVNTKESAITRKLRSLMDRGNREGEAFPAIVATGENTALPHHQTGNTPIKNNDFILLDFGVKVNNYCSDLTRTIVIGSATKKQQRIYDIVAAAQSKAIEAVKDGVSARTVDAVAREYITKKGFGKAFGHGLGHGIGIEIHEAPMLSPKSKDILKAGTVVTIEPGIYIPGVGGVRIEDDILVTHDGCEILSSAAK